MNGAIARMDRGADAVSPPPVRPTTADYVGLARERKLEEGGVSLSDTLNAEAGPALRYISVAMSGENGSPTQRIAACTR